MAAKTSPMWPTPAAFKPALPIAINSVTGIRIDSIPNQSRLRDDLHQIVTFVAAEMFFKKTANLDSIAR